MTAHPTHLPRAAAPDMAERIEALEAAIGGAIAMLDASLFTNSEHAQARAILAVALQEKSDG